MRGDIHMQSALEHTSALLRCWPYNGLSGVLTSIKAFSSAEKLPWTRARRRFSTVSGGAGPTSLKDEGMLSLVSCTTRLRAAGVPYALPTKDAIKKAGESFMAGGGGNHSCFSCHAEIPLYVGLSRGPSYLPRIRCRDEADASTDCPCAASIADRTEGVDDHDHTGSISRTVSAVGAVRWVYKVRHGWPVRLGTFDILRTTVPVNETLCHNAMRTISATDRAIIIQDKKTVGLFERLLSR